MDRFEKDDRSAVSRKECHALGDFPTEVRMPTPPRATIRAPGTEHRLVQDPDRSTVLYIGAENWPFPIPLVSKKAHSISILVAVSK